MTDFLLFIALTLVVIGLLVGGARVMGMVRSDVIMSNCQLSDDEIERMRADWDALYGTNEHVGMRETI